MMARFPVVMKHMDNKRGFSMLEILMAIGLFGMVAAVVFSVYVSGAKAWHRTENQAEVQQNLRIAIGTLTKELRKADSFKIRPGNREVILTYEDGSTKGYRFHPAAGEIRISESGAAVAMHIEDLKFVYKDNLVIIEITTRAMDGIKEETYTISINTRGKRNDG